MSNVVNVSNALQDKVILVTGAYGGLGEAVSVACAQAGATVILLGRKVPRLNRVYDRICASGDLPEPLNYPLDLEGATPDDYADLAQRIEANLGRLDGIVHCAAHFKGLTPLELTDPAELARTLHVNLTARLWLTQACFALLEASQHGVVVFAIDTETTAHQAYWGGYGLSQQATQSAVKMLQAERSKDTGVIITGATLGPMRTALRARAYVTEDVNDPVTPDAYAAAIVNLLATATVAEQGGKILEAIPVIVSSEQGLSAGAKS